MGRPFDLIRGQRTKLSELTGDTRLRISIHLEGPDAGEVSYLALLLTETQEAIAPNAVVWEDHPASEDGSVVAKPRKSLDQTFELDLNRVPSNAASVLFAIGMLGSGRNKTGSAKEIKTGSWSIEAGGSTVAKYEFSGRDFGTDGAIAVGEIYRKSGIWRTRAVGDGFSGGVGPMLSRYKVVPSMVQPPTGHGPIGSPTGGGIVLASAPAGIWLPDTWAGHAKPAVPRDLTRSVGLVICKTAEGTVHTGTGWMVTPGGHFVTCHHVVHDAVDFSICLEGTKLLRKAEIVALDADSDLALCYISDKNGAPDWLLLASQSSPANLGDELGLLAYPLGVDLGISVTYSQGIINSLRKRQDLPVLQIDVGAAPGSSGGPVFRRSDGHVLGVLSSGLNMGDRGMLINFAVDVRTIWKLGWLQSHT